MSFEQGTDLNMEQAPKIEIKNLGWILEGQGLIGSTLHEAEQKKFAQYVKDSMVKVEDTTLACVDGRRCLHQADGSEPKIRPRVAGGSLAPFVMSALGSDEFALKLTSQVKTMGGVVERIQHLEVQLGEPLGAHFGCGAANGLVEHINSMAQGQRPNSKVVAQLMANEDPDFNSESSLNRSLVRAKSFGKFLQAIGWDGKEFSENIAHLNGSGVEKLDTPEDKPNHGHAEDAWVIIDGPADESGRPIHTLDDEKLFGLANRRVFALNLGSLRHHAEVFGSNRQKRNELFCAALDWHLNGVGYNLADGTQPVFFVTIS